MSSALDAALQRYSDRLDSWLADVMPTQAPGTEPLYDMVHYHLGWIDEHGQPSSSAAAMGKRIRPALALLACESLGGGPDEARGAAAAVELIHNFSLVHDDIQDHSPTRRHRATVWNRWGAEQAINVGDLIFTLAQLALIRLSDAPPETITRAITVLNDACVKLVEGQYMDLAMVDASQCTRAEYFAMIERKTGALIAATCQLGALYSGASPETQRQFATFGLELGIAFQIQDDLLGVWGTDTTGKPADADIRERKKALPALIGLEKADSKTHWLRNFYSSTAPVTDADVERVRQDLSILGTRAEVEALAEEHHHLAIKSLNETGAAGEARVLLDQLLETLLNRES